MARNHTKAGTAGAFGQGDPQETGARRVRGRNAGGQLHRRGEGRKAASPIIAEAVVAHVEKTEFELKASVKTKLAELNEKFELKRAAEASRALRAAEQARRDICGIIHVPSATERHARIAASIAQHC